MAVDCVLDAYDTCAGWVWVFSAVDGAVWGNVFDPEECPGGCLNGGALSEVWVYSRCASGTGVIGEVRVVRVDAVGCPTALLWSSGSITTTHCVSGDRWTHVATRLTHLGNPFAIQLEWAGSAGSPNHVQFATDNGIANLFCSMGVYGSFPGCSGSTLTCSGWTIPPQRAFIYIADLNGDTILDDICSLYGAPFPLSFPYFYPYGYLPNNLMLRVGLDCSTPTAVVPTTWGRVKSLFE